MRVARLVPAVVAAALLSTLFHDAAEARVEASPGYTKQQTYSGALRYLRVDQGYEILERDPDAAYLLFRYTPPGRRESVSGSVEIVQTRGEVKLYVQLPKMPEYHERVLRDALLKKLREEYGEPRPPAPPPEKPPADAGAD